MFVHIPRRTQWNNKKREQWRVICGLWSKKPFSKKWHDLQIPREGCQGLCDLHPSVMRTSSTMIPKMSDTCGRLKPLCSGWLTEKLSLLCSFIPLSFPLQYLLLNICVISSFVIIKHFHLVQGNIIKLCFYMLKIWNNIYCRCRMRNWFATFMFKYHFSDWISD